MHTQLLFLKNMFMLCKDVTAIRIIFIKNPTIYKINDIAELFKIFPSTNWFKQKNAFHLHNNSLITRCGIASSFFKKAFTPHKQNVSYSAKSGILYPMG